MGNFFIVKITFSKSWYSEIHERGSCMNESKNWYSVLLWMVPKMKARTTSILGFEFFLLLWYSIGWQIAKYLDFRKFVSKKYWNIKSNISFPTCPLSYRPQWIQILIWNHLQLAILKESILLCSTQILHKLLEILWLSSTFEWNSCDIIRLLYL